MTIAVGHLTVHGHNIAARSAILRSDPSSFAAKLIQNHNRHYSCFVKFECKHMLETRLVQEVVDGRSRQLGFSVSANVFEICNCNITKVSRMAL
jgi:hypothetical protein